MARETFAFDIETDTTIDGRDPTVAAIVSIALYSDSCQAVIDGGCEEERLRRFGALLEAQPPGIAVTWNGCAFDIPFLADRADRCGVDLGIEMIYDPTMVTKYEPLNGHPGSYRARLGGHDHADVMWAYKRTALEAGVRYSLKPFCAHMGIEMVEVDREAIHLLSKQELRDYNVSDARGTWILGDRLGDDIERWVDNIVALRAA